MRRDIRRILLHASELVDVEERIVNANSFLFEEYGQILKLYLNQKFNFLIKLIN